MIGTENSIRETGRQKNPPDVQINYNHTSPDSRTTNSLIKGEIPKLQSFRVLNESNFKSPMSNQ